MPSQKNIHSLAQVKHDLDAAKAVIFTNYSGLSVVDQTTLRAKLAEVGGKFMVAKNNLIKLALKEKLSDMPSEINNALNGPTGVIIASDDAVMTTKALTEFAKEKEKPEVKLGLMDGKVLSASDITTLSKLPSKNELLAKLLAQLAAPITSFVRQINAPAQRLVYALEAIKATK